MKTGIVKKKKKIKRSRRSKSRGLRNSYPPWRSIHIITITVSILFDQESFFGGDRNSPKHNP